MGDTLKRRNKSNYRTIRDNKYKRNRRLHKMHLKKISIEEHLTQYYS